MKIHLSKTAFMKTIALINGFAGEVGWHGVVDRIRDKEFKIEDILVYPQQASGSSIDTEQFEYEKWLMTQDDCVFSRIRQHGHSHVNFSVTPSSKDDKHRDGLVSQLNGDDYYIFMVWNKKLDYNILLYDCAPKLLYCTNDIVLTTVVGRSTVSVREIGIETARQLTLQSVTKKFLSEAKKIVTVA